MKSRPGDEAVAASLPFKAEVFTQAGSWWVGVWLHEHADPAHLRFGPYRSEDEARTKLSEFVPD